jgi:DNA gyrase subunit B
MLQSAEVGTLITALGCGVGRDEFNLDNLRYHRIIIMTDADVDGSHIRTLLLTFFYRQMPELIDGGHLYIAQPPLYKVARGGSEVYCKDERALEDYLIAEGLKEAALIVAGGEARGGDDLREIVRHARRVRAILQSLPPRYATWIIEQAALAGALEPDPARIDRAAVAAELARRLDLVSDEMERGWTAEPIADGAGFRVTRTVRGVRESHRLDAHLIDSAEARKLTAEAKDLTPIYREPVTLRRRDETRVAVGPTALVEAVLDLGRRGLSLQRYKGLGEMNPEQLWETTLDPEVRSLLQVRVTHVDTADEIFSKLMGEVVEPRRDFIQENALNVVNLDV